ncbi:MULTISPECIES: amino acid ABC transporter permease [Metabacillus]|uniref:Amino acid ABC transporter permease n=1 Tax=Metabacillus hrfriensis TaxID=3048891 RepID=A0ACD4REX1_9BACI|nr:MULTISPECIES: amino acid ABC transporter permease [Metabacillus]UAL53482.1 amino acid ABC transporter permease [Metabacillus dongyingensis]USK29807.1 amino acid ABC transporter permease [Bacillus sp. CMF21]WHZ59053.1 amino acid ABC transporter permease [Metabacillus sp. CT-WN-B3]
MLDFSILVDNMDMYLEGFKNTVMASLIALIGSFLLGTLIAVLRIAPLKPLNWLGTVYVEFVRNIPLLIIAFFFYIGLPALGLRLDGFTAGTIALVIYTASFIAEAIRAGILSVPKGQMEAARSSGLTYNQTMRLIILPQAIKIVIPPLGNQFINLVKNSSILSVVAGLDLMYHGDLISSDTFVVFDVYIFVAVFYLILTIPLSIGVGYLEKRLAKSN